MPWRSISARRASRSTYSGCIGSTTVDSRYVPELIARSISRSEPGLAVVSRNASARNVYGRSPTITSSRPPSPVSTWIARSRSFGSMCRVKQSRGS